MVVVLPPDILDWYLQGHAGGTEIGLLYLLLFEIVGLDRAADMSKSKPGSSKVLKLGDADVT